MKISHIDLRYLVIGIYTAAGLFLLAEIAWTWREMQASIGEYLSAGAAGYLAVAFAYTVPVSCLLLAGLVAGDARWSILLPFMAHTVAMFPLALVPPLLLLIHRARTSSGQAAGDATGR